MTQPTPLSIRFWRFVSEPDGNGCRHWLGYVNPQNGYGQITLSRRDASAFGTRVATAPVVACTLSHGPRPQGMSVLHSCDVRSCCEPSHLSWGTTRRNNRDAWDRGRQRSGEAHHQAKLSDVQVLELMGRAKAGASVHLLAAEYGVDGSHVYKWLRGKGRGARLLEGAA